MTPKIKKLLPLIIVLVLLISIPIGIYLVQRQTQIKSKAVNDTTRTVDLQITSANASVVVGNTFTAQVIMDAATAFRADISGVDFQVNYPVSTNKRTSATCPDVANVGAVSVTGFAASSFSGSQIVTLLPSDAINNSVGTMHFAAFDNALSPVRGGIFTIGTLTFTAVQPGCVTISFGDVLVSATSQDAGVTIDNKQDLNLTVTGPPATVTGFTIPTPSGGTFVQGVSTPFTMNWALPNPTSSCSLQLHNGTSFANVVANEPGFGVTLPHSSVGTNTISFDFTAPPVSGGATKPYRLRIQCTNSAGQASDSNEVTVTAYPAHVPGDATADYCVNNADRNCWSSKADSADFNNNGVVDLSDYTIWLDANNSGRYVCAVGQSRSTCSNYLH